MTEHDVLVTGEDLRTARNRFGGFCASGSARWFTRQGLSLRYFLQHGYPASVLSVDEFGKRVAAMAHERLSK
jgi:hypothetical protein